MSGWLQAQLPRAMGGNALVEAFVDAAEGIGDSIRVRLDGLEYQLDPDLAPPEMLAYLAGWLGFPLDRLDDASLHRPLLRAIGRLLAYRGTKDALAELLAELTGGPVRVRDGGGVWGPGETMPPANPVVRAELSRIGPVSEDRLAAIAARELPIGAVLELVVPTGAQTGGG
jgi:phage tail-like protein